MRNNRAILPHTTEYVSIVNTKSDVQSIYASVKKGFDLLEEPKVRPDDMVVIKPNLCTIKTPETGATTDRRLIAGITRYLKNELGVSNIFIVESDGTSVNADMAFKLLGYKKLSERLNVKLINLTKSVCSSKIFTKNLVLKKIEIPRILERADFFISVPKIKTHDLCSFTAALKNQYGCNPYPRKITYHKKLHDVIVDLNVAFRPDFIVVDGIVAMEGSGPVSGIPVKMDTLIFGKDPVATDHLIARIMGINPDGVKYLVEAERRGVGTTSYNIRGQNLDGVKRKFRSRPSRRNLYGLL